MSSKKNPVIVMGNENGAVITVNENNPEQGSIWLSQSVFEMDHISGFVNKRTRNAWLQGSIQNVLSELHFKVGQEVPGNIVRFESFEPFSRNPEYAEKDIKIAGDSGVVCKQEGKAIYSIARYVMDDTVEDVLISHDNGDEIKAANAAKKATQAVETPNADFSIGG